MVIVSRICNCSKLPLTSPIALFFLMRVLNLFREITSFFSPEQINTLSNPNFSIPYFCLAFVFKVFLRTTFPKKVTISHFTAGAKVLHSGIRPHCCLVYFRCFHIIVLNLHRFAAIPVIKLCEVRSIDQELSILIL